MPLTLTATEPVTQPPIAKIVPKETTLHGDTRTDNYCWLRDRKDPDAIAYLEAENAYRRTMMRHTEDLQASLYTEMLSHIQQTDLTVPVKRDEYFYYTRTEEGKQYRIYCRKHGSLEAAEEILLDGNILAEGHKYFQIGAFAPSPNHKLLAYSTDYTGDEIFTVSVKNLETGEMSPGEIRKASHWLEWAADNATLFYTVLDSARRPYKVLRHRLGDRESGVTGDVEIYHETDQRFDLEVSKTSSREYLLIGSASSLTTEIRYLRADQPEGEFRIALPRVQGVEYDLTHHGDSFFIRTNDGAKTFRVVEAPVADCSKANWKEILPARPEVTIEGVSALAGYLVFEERERGLGKIRMRSFTAGDGQSGETYSIDFPEPVYSIALTGNAEYDTRILRFTYTSLVMPASVFDYNLETRQRELKKQQEVPGGFDPGRYESERIHATAPDGVEVPISLVYKKGTVRDGSAPMLLYGYGAYGISVDPSFSSDRLSLLDRGVIYAIAHVRGGGDLGKLWHEDGRLLKKRNTFTDFIACAEALVAARYTSTDRLAIEGRSAGGMLVGAVVNMRPELFSIVLAGVPFVDVLNTILDATLPLTVGEYEEWGDPNEKQFYDSIKSYAPYENVHAARYPAMLITAGLNDPRVSYWEPAKWTAKLRATSRALKTDDRLLLLKTNMGSGHFGSSGRYEYLKETALNYAFLLNALGIEPKDQTRHP
jgi:oligopeptidase B